MKLLRFFLRGFAAFCAIVLALAVIGLAPSFQTWAARRALAAHPAWRLSVGGLALGLGQSELREIRWEHGGAVLTLPALDADLPVVRSALSSRVLLRRVVARGWTLDLTRTKVGFDGWGGRAAFADRRPPAPSLLPAAYAADPDATATREAAARVFQGLFRQLQLPVGVELEELELQGTVILPPPPGRPPLRVAVDLSGGGLGAGEEGRFPFHCAAAPGAGAPVSSLTADGTVLVAMDTPRTISRFSVHAVATAVGAQVPPGATLAADFAGERSGPGESYTIGLAGAAKQLAAVQANFSYGTGRVAGAWKLDVADADLAPFALGRALPGFVALGDGRFDTDGSFASIRASGRLTATTDQVGAFLPGQPSLGAAKLTAVFDAAIHGLAWRVDRLSLALDGTHPLLSARALQAFEFDAGTGELKVADPTRDLLDIALKGIPLEWVQPYLPDFTLTGGEIHGEILAGARSGGLVLRPKLPVTTEGLTVVREGRPLIRGCDVLLSASADYTPAGWQAKLSPFMARDGDGNSLVLELRVGRLAGGHQPLKIAGRLDAKLSAISGQPGIAKLTQLQSGIVACEFSSSLAERRSIEAKLLCSQLKVGEGGPLPDVAIQLRADDDATGRISFTAPIGFQAETGKSALIVAGTAHISDGTLMLNAQLESAALDIEDLGALAFIAARGHVYSSSNFGGYRDMAQTKPDRPSWAWIKGMVSIDLKKLVGPGLDASDVHGSLQLSDHSVELDGLQGVVGAGGKIGLDGVVAFDSGLGQPYSVRASLTGSQIESGPIFLALDPDRPPTLEGTFDLDGRLLGRGRDLVELGQQLQGDLQLTSKAGVFRALSSGALPPPAEPGKPSEIEAIIGDVTGAVTGRKDAAEGAAGKARAVVNLAAAIAAIHYDQIKLEVLRGPSLDTELKNFSLISPEIRLEGGGGTTYQKGVPWLRQPLALQFRLRARGRTADALQALGMLDAKKDELGYATCSVPLEVGGTLEDPDTSDLRMQLLEAAYRQSGARDLIDRLLGLK